MVGMTVWWVWRGMGPGKAVIEVTHHVEGPVADTDDNDA